MGNINVCLTSGNDKWRTPFDLLKGLESEFMFDFDPCPSDPTFNGLEVEWGESNFVNPPYSTKLQNAFVKKAIIEWNKGKTVVLLLPVRTGSIRWQELILPYATEIRFLKRLKFQGAKNVAPFDSALVIFKSKKREIKE